MVSRKDMWVAVFILAIAIGGAHLSKRQLDRLHPSHRFQELLYVPKGRALKVLACGFEAPLADFLWVQGQLYFSDNLRSSQLRHARAARYRYVYQIHDVITEFQPRFTRAYLFGALYLMTTGDQDLVRQGLLLLQKGVAAFEQAEQAGRPIVPDERWRLYIHMANAYDQHLHEPLNAVAYYEKALARAECPENIYFAYAGFQQQLKAGAGVVERHDAMIEVWSDLLKRIERHGTLDESLKAEVEKNLNTLKDRRRRILVTKDIERRMDAMFVAFRAKTGRVPRSIGEVLAMGGGGTLPRLPFHGHNDYHNMPDYFMTLPDGHVRSYVLARMEADLRLQYLFFTVKDFFDRNKSRFPGRLALLEKAGLLRSVPVHPLAPLGYRFVYNPLNGDLGIYDPEFKKVLNMGNTDLPPGVKPVEDVAPPPSAPSYGRKEQPKETSEKPSAVSVRPVAEGHVRVAAVQFCSTFGDPEGNRARLVPMIQKAAAVGAKIIVLPEACIPGYADLENEIYWTKKDDADGFRNVAAVAETADGESIRQMGRLADTLDIYLTVPLIEQDGEEYYISVFLVDPAGKTILHHRKYTLWDVADAAFASEGPADPPVVDTPYGRLGCMLCRDMHSLPEKFAAQKVDLLLHAAAFYGPNFEGYLRAPKFLQKFVQGKMHLVLANHSVKKRSWWSGYGMSRVIRSDGVCVSRARHDLGDNIVIADLPVPKLLKQ